MLYFISIVLFFLTWAKLLALTEKIKNIVLRYICYILINISILFIFLILFIIKSV